MKITVIGCGRWGSFHAWHADRIGHEVTLYGRKNSATLQELSATRKNAYLTLPESVKISTDLFLSVESAEVVIISVGAQNLRGLLQEIKNLQLNLREKKFVFCMKGLECGTGKRLTEIFVELKMLGKVAVWVGPGHVQDFVRGIPNCMVMSSADEILTRELVEIFKSPLVRFYYGKDLIGTEIGAAAKNVVGLAAGMLDGLDLTGLKGALMARGTAELSRLIEALGGEKMTVYGLSHLGDYEATLFSEFSHNRRFGENFVTGAKFNKLAEGVETVKALMELSKATGVELPISRAVYKILHEGAEPKEQLTQLFLRSTKAE